MDTQFKTFVICIIIKIVVVSHVHTKPMKENPKAAEIFFKKFMNRNETDKTDIPLLSKEEMDKLKEKILPKYQCMKEYNYCSAITIVKEKDALMENKSMVEKTTINAQAKNCWIELDLDPEETPILKLDTVILHFRKEEKNSKRVFVMAWATGPWIIKVIACLEFGIDSKKREIVKDCE